MAIAAEILMAQRNRPSGQATAAAKRRPARRGRTLTRASE